MLITDEKIVKILELLHDNSKQQFLHDNPNEPDSELLDYVYDQKQQQNILLEATKRGLI